MAISFKVLTQKDKWFTSKFDPQQLEAAINAYANQGWSVTTGATASFPGFFSNNREEMVVILERDEGRQDHFEYKVLTQKDKWFTSKFDPATIESAINAYATQGWRVKYAATASFPGFFSNNREEMIIIMERPKTK